MKFLPPELVRPHMMPLNILYNDPLKDGKGFDMPDILTIVLKDQDTNYHYVYDIKNPEIEIYIVKEEYRTFGHRRDMIEISQCNKIKVPYRTRWSKAGEKLGISPEEAKVSPYVFGADIPIETYYLINFIMEYPSDMAKGLSLGKLDIENDIIQCDGFPEPGQTPINAVTYINMDSDDVYTLILLKDNLPKVIGADKDYAYWTNLRSKFNQQVSEVQSHPEHIVDLCHKAFDEMYPGMTYNIIYYDDEVSLLKDLLQIIHQTDNDFIGIWNMPYDMQNIIMRCTVLGLDPTEVISDERFKVKKVFFREDTNPVAHKRKHECLTSTIPTFVDDMVHYAGIRSGGGVQASLKLNNVAEKELQDTKYDYSEISDIKHLYYEDLEKFILYNIKDVLLMVALERKNKDTAVIYSRMYQMFVFPKEAFTTTKVVLNSFLKFALERGYVHGSNRNKGKHHKEIIDYSAVLGDQLSGIPDDEDLDDIDFDLDLDDDSDGEESGKNKEEKYSGAFVLNTLHMLPTGTMVMNKPAKYVHDYVADLDVGSEYPTAINTCNISNETLVAKVYLQNPDDVDIPIPEGFVFRGNDKTGYKMDKGNFLVEQYSEGDVSAFSHTFLNLPTESEILDGIEELIKA